MAILAMHDRFMLLRRIPFEKRPEALVEIAQQFLVKVGYSKDLKTALMVLCITIISCVISKMKTRLLIGGENWIRKRYFSGIGKAPFHSRPFSWIVLGNHPASHQITPLAGVGRDLAFSRQEAHISRCLDQTCSKITFENSGKLT